MPTDIDRELLLRVRDGDALAFAEIDRRYRRQLTAFAGRLLGSVHDAEDVVQEAMVRAFDRLPRDTRDIELSPWLHRVVRNACFDLLRHRQRTAAMLDGLTAGSGSAEDAHGAALRREQFAAVVSDVGRLPVRQKDALVLACVDGLPHAEVARRLQSTVPGTKSLLLRARANLARMAQARDELAERSRRAATALLAPIGKLAAVTGATAPAALLSVAAIGAPIVLTGAGKVVSQDTVAPSQPAPRLLDYGPFRIDRGAPLPDGMQLVEATIELPAGESAPRTRRLSITCPLGFVQTGISTGMDAALNRLSQSERSSERRGRSRRAVLLFRPKPNLLGPHKVRLGVECATPEYWRLVGKVYGDWAECEAISDGIRRMRRHGESVPRGLVRARRMDCRETRRRIRAALRVVGPLHR